MWRRNPGLALAAVAGLCWPAAILACGPFFPNRVLLPSDRMVLSAPQACFRSELKRLCPGDGLPFKAVPPKSGSYERQTIEADLSDLQAALKAAGAAADRQARLLADYRRLAESLRRGAWQEEHGREQNPAASPPADLALAKVPEGLPGEFEDYARGALAWRQGDAQEARRRWQKLLERPAAERPRRSTWAAFMLGKSRLEDDDAEAAAWFAKVRALAGEGFQDSLGLASASLGWQARAEMNRQRYDLAIEFYLEQFATGDDTAVASLQSAARELLAADEETIERAAALETVRPAVTAYIVSREGWRWGEGLSEQAKAWLAAAERAAVRRMDGADRLALVAYQLGEMDLAERWLNRAPPGTPLAKWLRAKLLMRAGRLDGALVLLAQVARDFPADERVSDALGWGTTEYGSNASIPAARQVRGELGALHLARRHFVEALDALVRGDFRADAAYVAERVLHLDELVAYVDRNWPEARPSPEPAREQPAESEEPERPAVEDLGAWIRRVLARRLAREGKLQEARGYFPEALRARLDELTGALQAGRDGQRGSAERAGSLWKAAQIARGSGIALMGTEVEPDWAIYGGFFAEQAFSAMRGDAQEAQICVRSPEELKRAEAHPVAPEKRYHYRYMAAGLAWQAAELMPDHSDETAKVLYTAGCWLKDRDPQEADRFYKSLVRRCRKTELGRQADGLRWFPKPAPKQPAAEK